MKVEINMELTLAELFLIVLTIALVIGLAIGLTWIHRYYDDRQIHSHYDDRQKERLNVNQDKTVHTLTHSLSTHTETVRELSRSHAEVTHRLIPNRNSTNTTAQINPQHDSAKEPANTIPLKPGDTTGTQQQQQRHQQQRQLAVVSTQAQTRERTQVDIQTRSRNDDLLLKELSNKSTVQTSEYVQEPGGTALEVGSRLQSHTSLSNIGAYGGDATPPTEIRVGEAAENESPECDRQEPDGECRELDFEEIEAPHTYCFARYDVPVDSDYVLNVEESENSSGEYDEDNQQRQGANNATVELTEEQYRPDLQQKLTVTVKPKTILHTNTANLNDQPTDETCGTKPKRKDRRILPEFHLGEIDSDKGSTEMSPDCSDDSDGSHSPELPKPQHETDYNANQTNLPDDQDSRQDEDLNPLPSDESNSRSAGNQHNTEKELYSIDKDNPGTVLIINNIHFTNSLEERKGAEKDAEMLQKLFTDKKWNRIIYKEDLTADQIKAEIDKLASIEEKSCVAVFLLSHGELGEEYYVYGIDRQKVGVCLDVFRPLDEVHCVNLLNIPKLFFIQACQEENIPCVRDTLQDVPSKLTMGNCSPGVDTDCVDKEMTWINLQPKTCTNMLVFYSCRPTEMSLREQDRGSIFIQELVRHFATPEVVDVEEACLRIKRDVKVIARHYGYNQVPSLLPLLDKQLRI